MSLALLLLLLPYIRDLGTDSVTAGLPQEAGKICARALHRINPTEAYILLTCILSAKFKMADLRHLQI